MRHALSIAVALLTVTAATAVAQETTGALQGHVADEAGTVISGAVVTAKGPPGSVSTTSNDEGRYRLPRLAPGNYTVTAAFEGLPTVESDAVRVILGDTVTVDFKLQRGTFEDEIQVYSNTVAIDFSENHTVTSIRQREIDYLPRGRDFTDVVTFAAGVSVENQGGGIMVDGATGLENRFVIDGINTTDPERGLSSVPLRAEFMEEVQIKSAGYQAEYGGALGGVINAVTRSGSNEFHGGVFVDIENSSWNGSARPQLQRSLQDDGVTESVTYANDDEVRYDPGFYLGGPIVRDRLWFFASYVPGFRTTKRTVDWVSYSADTYQQDFQIDYATANLTANLGSKFLIKAGANVSPYSAEGFLPNRDGRQDLPDQEDWAPLGTEGDRQTYFLSLDWIASDGFVVSARGGFYQTNETDTGIPLFPVIHNYSAFSVPGFVDRYPEIPPEAQHNPGWLSDNLQTGVNTRNLYQRWIANVDGTWYFEAAGNHALKFGYQFEETSSDLFEGYNADRILYYWDRSYTTRDFESVQGPYGYFRLLNIGSIGEAAVRNDAVFVQDAWTVLPNLTLNLGLRSEYEQMPNLGVTGPDPAIEFGWGDKLAPRLGFAWDVGNDGRWKVYGSYGTYYDATKQTLARAYFGGNKWVDFFFTFDNPDPFLNEAETCRTGTNTILERPVCPAGTFVESVDRRINTADPAISEMIGYPLIDPNLKPTESWEAQIGVDHQLAATIQIGARYVHKDLVRLIEDVGFAFTPDGILFAIGNPGEGTASTFYEYPYEYPYVGPVREYDALELSLDKRFSNNWSLRAYYTLGRLWGNFSGLVSTDEQIGFGDPADPSGSVRLSPNVSGHFDVPATGYDANAERVYGRLATDRTHQLRAQFLYSFPFGLYIGVNQFIGSGTPRSEAAETYSGAHFPYGRGTQGDTPWLTQTDLSLFYNWTLGKGYGFSIGVTVLNLFDEDTPTRYWERRTDGNLPVPPEEFFQGYDYDALIQSAPQDSAFDMADTFQPPREIRLTLKFEF